MKEVVILVLAPHTDDGELACGATISKMVRLGCEVHYVAFSSCSDSLPAGYQSDCLVREMYKATATLGIPKTNVSCLNYTVRNFQNERQKILDSMIQINARINPDIVLSPSIHDIHQDHVTIAKECLRAFKKKTVLQYEVPWNNYTFDNQLFSCVEDEDVERKARAVECYDSQKSRDYVSRDFLLGLLVTHGVQIGCKYAEVFEIPRMIVGTKQVL